MSSGVTGRADQDQVHFVLDHFWDNRGLARVILNGVPMRLIADALSELIGQRMTQREVPDGADRLTAIGAASGVLSMLRAWLTGRVACDARILARQLCSRAFTLGG